VAFTTQEGTGGAPWTFQGTPEADSIAVITGNVQNSAAFDFIAEGFEGDDTINFNGTRSVNIRGGQGADVITNNVAASAGLTSIITTSFINGNDGDDRIGNSQIGLLATLSTVSGGQGSDQLFIGSLQSSKVNGNLGSDFLEIGDLQTDEDIVGSFSNFNAASIFGGQSDDLFLVASENRQITQSQVSGQLGNDVMSIQVGTFSLQDAITENSRTFGGFSLFSPDAGIGFDPSTAGTTFSGGDGNDIIDASGLLIDVGTGGGFTIDGDPNAGSGSDLTLVGDNGDDSVFGGAGEDEIAGGDGADWLAGYANRDVLVGGSGNDLLIGAYFDGDLSVGFIGDGAGDFLSGGTGANRFFVPGSSAVRSIGQVAGNTLGSTQSITLTKNNGGTATGTAAITVAEGDLLTANFGADVITDWNAGSGANSLDTGIGNNLVVGNPATPANMSFAARYSGTTAAGTFGNYAVRGFYTERANEVGQFVVNNAGPDIAVWTNYTGTQFNAAVTAGNATASYTSSIDNFTVLRGAGTSVVVTANEFVAI
jgi:hypothetical protein